MVVSALCMRGPVPRRSGDPLLDSRCLRLTYASAADVCIMYAIIFLGPRCVFSHPVLGPQPPVVFRGRRLEMRIGVYGFNLDVTVYTDR